MGQLLVSIIKRQNVKYFASFFYSCTIFFLDALLLCEKNAECSSLLTYRVLQKPPCILATIHLDVCSSERLDLGLFPSWGPLLAGRPLADLQHPRALLCLHHLHLLGRGRAGRRPGDGLCRLFPRGAHRGRLGTSLQCRGRHGLLFHHGFAGISWSRLHSKSSVCFQCSRPKF